MGGELPAAFLRKVQRLGFVLVDGEAPYTLVRLDTWGELRLLVQASGQDAWRVGAASRAADHPGQLPNPVLSISLGQYAPSADGITLEVSTADLCTAVPRLLRNGLLPARDILPGG
jgi:hypothetical protein